MSDNRFNPKDIKDQKTAPIVVGTTTTAATASASTPSDPGAELKLFFMDVAHQFLNELPGDAKDLTKEQANNRERVRGQLPKYFYLFAGKDLTFHPADLIEFTQLIASLEKEISNPLTLKNKGPIFHFLGLAYRLGLGVKKDEAKAKEYFNQAIKINYSLSLVGLGEMGDPKHAIALYTQAANAGCAYGYYSLGGLYRLGNKAPQDYKKAREYYQKAGELGDASGWNNLGYMHAYGEGGPKDQKTANEFYQKAADLNSLSGFYGAASTLNENHFVTKVSFYEKAAMAGMNLALEGLIALKSKHPKEVSFALVNIGSYVFSRGNTEMAHKCFDAIDPKFLDSLDPKSLSVGENFLFGGLCERYKNVEKAFVLYRATINQDEISYASSRNRNLREMAGVPKINQDDVSIASIRNLCEMAGVPKKGFEHLCALALNKVKPTDNFKTFSELLNKMYADASPKLADQKSGPGLFDASSAAAPTVTPSTGLRKRHPHKKNS